MRRRKPYRIFISAISRDRDVAEDLAHRLEDTGVEVCFDEASLKTGDTVIERADRALRKSDEVIVLLTSNSMGSPGVMSEMGAAFALHKRVVPIVLGIEHSDLPPLVKHMSYLRYPQVSRYLSDLEKRTAEVRAAG